MRTNITVHQIQRLSRQYRLASRRATSARNAPEAAASSASLLIGHAQVTCPWLGLPNKLASDHGGDRYRREGGRQHHVLLDGEPADEVVMVNPRTRSSGVSLRVGRRSLAHTRAPPLRPPRPDFDSCSVRCTPSLSSVCDCAGDSVSVPRSLSQGSDCAFEIFATDVQSVRLARVASDLVFRARVC